MRIGIDVRPALRRTTGVGRYLLGLCPALADHDEAVVAFSSSWKDRLDGSQFPGCSVVDRRIPVRALNWLWNRARVPAFERLAGAADVVHAPGPLSIPTARAARVVTVHDLFFLLRPDTVVREMQRDWVPLAARAVREADAVVCVSEWAATVARERLGADAARLFVAHHGLEPGWWQSPEPALARLRLARLGVTEPYLLAVGSLETRKNYPALLRAFARVRRLGRNSLALVIAGPDGPAGAGIRELAISLGLGGSLHLIGYCDDDDLRALYARADALTMPSLDEGFGFPVLEAMAAGCPVLAANAGALPEVAGDAALRIDPLDEEALASGLVRIIDDERLRETLIAAGRVRARGFHWRNSAARHLEAYRHAIEHRQ